MLTEQNRSRIPASANLNKEYFVKIYHTVAHFSFANCNWQPTAVRSLEFEDGIDIDVGNGKNLKYSTWYQCSWKWLYLQIELELNQAPGSSAIFTQGHHFLYYKAAAS